MTEILEEEYYYHLLTTTWQFPFRRITPLLGIIFYPSERQRQLLKLLNNLEINQNPNIAEPNRQIIARRIQATLPEDDSTNYTHHFNPLTPRLPGLNKLTTNKMPEKTICRQNGIIEDQKCLY